MVRRIFGIVVAGILWTSYASASACLPDASVARGPIFDKWTLLGGSEGRLGCPLTDERAVPDSTGRFVQFLHGRVVWSPQSRLVVAAVETTVPESGVADVEVSWRVLSDSSSYDYFVVRWFAEGETTHGQQDADPVDPKGTRGFVNILGAGGHYAIEVVGCHGGPLAFSFAGRRGYDPLFCPGAWSDPLEIDVGYLDLSKPGVALQAPVTVDAARAGFHDRRLVGILRHCRAELKAELSEDSTAAALARLDAASLGGADVNVLTRCAEKPEADVDAARARLTGDVAGWLGDRKVTAHAGTGVEKVYDAKVGAAVGAGVGVVAVATASTGPFGLLAVVAGAALGAAPAACSRHGEYDFALMNLIPIAYDHAERIGPDAYDHLLNVLLDQRGGKEEVSEHIVICGVPIPETENHVLMTEAARYLTNQLLMKQAVREHAERQAGPNAFLEAQRKYDNAHNGMNVWMLATLQGLLKNDFHEYHARPYARLTVKALQNLAAYAGPESPNREIGLAAEMVLDYLAAQFAVSSSELRRAAPFRRRGENKDRPELYGRQSDSDTWRFLGLIGPSETFLRERMGRASWIASQAMAFPRVKPGTTLPRYEVPSLITDLMINDQHRTFWQGFRHEGVEIYASQPEFFISGGGIWQPSGARDRLFGRFFPGADTQGQALPTTLIPTFDGADRNRLVRIAGHTDEEKRANSCVAPGFACGLNPTIPAVLLNRFPASPRACAFDAAGPIADEWRRHGAQDGPLGCAVDRELDTGADRGRVQAFERGQIVWSPSQQMVLSAHYSQTESRLNVKWRIVGDLRYDYFIVRWDKDGGNLGQRDVKNGIGVSRAGGEWSLALESAGAFAVRVEGCNRRFLRSSKCGQGWAQPLIMDFPSKRSCARGQGNWLFVSQAAECHPQIPATGYFVASFRAGCEKGSKCKGQQFGFFEVRKPVCTQGQGGFDKVKNPRDEAEDERGGPSADSGLRMEADQDTATPCQTFDNFVQDVLTRNGSTAFSSRGENDYRMPQDHVIRFVPDHVRGETGIVRIDGKPPEVPARIADWGREAGLAPGDGLLGATGTVISADGRGCVVIRNRALGQSLILNLRDTARPTRLLDQTSGTRTCKDVRDER